ERTEPLALRFPLREAHLLALARATLRLPKVRPGCSKVAEGALDRALCHLVDPGKLLAFDGVEARLQVQWTLRLAPVVKRLLDLFESPVVDKPGGSCGLAEIDFLLRRRIEPDFVSALHRQELSSQN